MSLAPFLLAAPFVAAVLCLVAGRFVGLVSAVGAVATALLAVLVAFDSFTAPPQHAIFGLVYVDALSGLITLIVGLISVAATLYSVGYLRNAVAAGEITAGQVRWFHLWIQLSIAAMIAVPLMNNLGLMWVAIETTTLFTALLVAFVRRGHALEAAWKYLMLGAVGLAFALFGLLLTYYAASQSLGDAAGALDWDELRANAKLLDPDLMRFAFALVLVGFGTKAGLAPMHTWLPDAHGQAPTPVSVILSGALLNCALYGILRFHLLTAGAAGERFSSDLLLGFGGPLGLFAAAFHMFNHAVGKTVLFVAAGAIGQRYGTLRLARLRGAMEVAPIPALGLLLGTLAITGSPPFAPFASEFGIARAGFTGRPFAFAGALVLVAGTVLVFGGMLFHVLKVVLRAAPRHLHPAAFPFGTAFIGVPLALLLLLGVWLPPVLRDGFNATARVLGVAP